MRKVSQSHHSSLNELNITPLLDLAFVLLVIFIITTPQMVNNLEMNLPSGTPPSNGPKPKLNKIDVQSSGKILLNDQELALPALKTTLAQLKAGDPEIGVVVNGSGEVQYQSMINVLDTLRQLDITKVGLGTDVAE